MKINNTKNRICICCGKSFYFCNKCNASSKNTGISMVFDTQECKELSNVISGYLMNKNTVADIKTVLEKYNVTDYNKYKQSVRDILNELFPKSKIKEVKEVKEIKETQDINEATNEQNENDIPKEVKPQRKRKSRKKKVVLSDETEKRDQSDNGDNL